MAAGIPDAGIGPYAIALRLFETADRLRDLATEAEEAHKIADATRATLAEAKTLNLLLSLGLRGAHELDFAGDADALEAAVAELVRTSPQLGDQIAEQLELRDRAAYADKLRSFANRCRALAEHHAVSTIKELTRADQ